MTNKEATKIITEFMGQLFMDYDEENIPQIEGSVIYDNVTGLAYPGNHYESLDNLVPVWMKLDMPNILELHIRQHILPDFGIRIYADLSYVQHKTGETIQEAALLATAKAIKETNAR